MRVRWMKVGIKISNNTFKKTMSELQKAFKYIFMENLFGINLSFQKH